MYCRASFANFADQDFVDKELVVVHDGPNSFAKWLEGLADSHPDIDVQLKQVRPGSSLGSLRNRTLEAASYPIVCQWDDDDLCHPSRLSVQYAHLLENKADFSFLTDQLHLFTRDQVMFWDDWSVEAWPGNLIQGTLMGKKELIGAYPDLRVGEDTDLVRRLVCEGYRIAPLSDRGWLYLYVFHGDNAWDETHHKEISRWKRRGEKALRRDLELLRNVLPAFRLPYTKVVLLHEAGRFTINLRDDQSYPE